MKSKLFVATLGLSLLLTGVTPTFAGAKGVKSSKAATTQHATGTKHLRHQSGKHHHKKLSKAEKKAIKHAVKKSQKKHTTAKI